MSKSPNHRAENLRQALRIMTAIVGAGRFDWTLFEPEDARFKEILATTWEDLEERGWLKRMSTPDYQLTAAGCVSALELAGVLVDAKMKEKLGKLCAAPKRRCQNGGRHRDGTTIQELAAETGFAEDWIYNAVECHLIR